MDIAPFKGLRFDPLVVSDVGNCICPPYDVIDADYQQKLYEKSPQNIVRIIKGKASDADNDQDNKYTRAAASLQEWIASGALKEDASEAIYGYVQDFHVAGGTFRRSGIVALGKIEEFGGNVQPHEKTLDGPKADRLKLMTATEAQFGQIFMLYDDPQQVADNIIVKASAKPAVIDFIDDDKVRHRLYVIDDHAEMGAIINMMQTKQSIIADGHHRYETALNYYKQSGNPKAAYRMMTFVNMRNEGLLVLPTHRLMANVDGFDINELIAKIQDTFEVSKYDFADDSQKADARNKMFERMDDSFKNNKNAFGIYAADDTFYTVELKKENALGVMCPDMSDSSKELDVNVLHKVILESMLGIGDKELAAQSNIKYIKDIADAVGESIHKVDTGDAQAVFFMNSTRVEQVNSVAAAGEKMPQKSTFFYPKVYTGLVVNKL
jgi:uncharacterized protein (DUF1015 family)